MSAAVFANATLLELINKEWSRIAPSTFLYKPTARDPCKVSSSIKKFYFGDDETLISQDNRQAVVDIYSDRFFVECTRETAKLYAEYAPVFLYNFTHKVEHSVGDLLGWKYDTSMSDASLLYFLFLFICNDMRSSRWLYLLALLEKSHSFAELKPPSHADELNYFFDFPVIPYAPGIPKGHSEESFSENMIKLWISFARNG